MKKETSTLQAALRAEGSQTKDLMSSIRGLIGPLGGVELQIEPREPMREPPSFD